MANSERVISLDTSSGGQSTLIHPSEPVARTAPMTSSALRKNLLASLLWPAAALSDSLDALCGCGNVGDVEGLVGGNAIGRRFSTLGYPDAASLFIAAKAGDTGAGALIDELCRVMGRTLYNLIATLDLQRISIGGSVFWHHRDWLLPKLRAEVAGKLPALTDGCAIVPAGLGERVGDFGALALVA